MLSRLRFGHGVLRDVVLIRSCYGHCRRSNVLDRLGTKELRYVGDRHGRRDMEDGIMHSILECRERDVVVVVLHIRHRLGVTNPDIPSGNRHRRNAIYQSPSGDVCRNKRGVHDGGAVGINAVLTSRIPGRQGSVLIHGVGHCPGDVWGVGERVGGGHC